MTIATQTQVLYQLGATVYRANALYLTSPDNPRPDIDQVAAAGYSVLMVVRASGENGTPTNPPADLNAYRATLQSVLARYHPAYLVVEDEQDNVQVYTGTAQQYLDELKVACEVAKAAAVPCVSGGFTSTTVIWLKARDMLARGQGAAALTFVQNAYPILMPDGPVPSFSSTSDLQRVVDGNAAVLDRAQSMLDGYPAAGVTYVNFHWYAPGYDAITGAIQYMRSASHGLPVVSDEFGQRDNSPEHTTAAINAVRDLALPLAVWFSIDCPPPNGARALTETDGTFRTTGQAFASLVHKSGASIRTQALALPMIFVRSP